MTRSEAAPEVGGGEDADGAWRRLHPASIFFRLLGLLRAAALPVLVLLGVSYFGGGRRESRFELWLVALIGIPTLAFQLYRYATTRYRLGRDELVVREGGLSREERHIPYRKLHNLDLEQSPLHRWFRVARVRLETGAGGAAEAVLDVLALADVEAIRRRIAIAAADAAVAPASGTTPGDGMTAADGGAPTSVLRLGNRELVGLGLTGLRGVVAIAVIVGTFAQLGLLQRIDVIGWLRRVSSAGGGQGAPPWLVLLAGLGAVAAVQLLAAAWTVVRFHRFRLDRLGDELRVRSGLWTRRAATVPRRRIQLVSVRQSLLHRLVGRVVIRVETAGGKEDERHDSLGEKWIAPFVAGRDLARVLGEMQPGLSIDSLPWRAVAAGARGRMVRRSLLLGIGLGALGLAVWRPWGALASAALAAALAGLAVRQAHILAWAVTDEAIAFRTGALTRRITIVRHDKLQTVWMTVSPFDRHHGHASLRCDTAGAGPAGHRIDIPYLDAGVARETAAHLLARVGDIGRAQQR